MMERLTLAALRAHAVARSLQPSATLIDAIDRIGFVQHDPIRAPARAADLILRQRVTGYRAGDLDRAYPALPLAEDYLHVYGVLPSASLALLHPRGTPFKLRVEREHPRLAARVLAHVQRHGETHPRDLAQSLSRARMASDWGGESVATTRMLAALHYRGKLKVARRLNGVKVYDVAATTGESLPVAARADAILKLLLDLYAPLSEATMRHLAWMVTESSLSRAQRTNALDRLRANPDVRWTALDGAAWLLTANEMRDGQCEERVRLLAPFDPIVWDRRRFAAFWGWEYRLEAYTPPSMRKFGYYALPLLWRDDVIGWANVAASHDALTVDVGYAKTAPRSPSYRRELDAELARLAQFAGRSRVDLRPTPR